MTSIGRGQTQMAITSTINISATFRRLSAMAIAVLATLGVVQQADAQEIPMSGPLAGAPAVRKLRLYREGRFELAPSVSVSILDQYNRTILVGGKLNYNLFDWLAIGVWGGFGAVQIPLALTEHIQETNASRKCDSDPEPNRTADDPDSTLNKDSVNCRATRVNVGPDLKKQVAQINWVVAPQLTVIPFRGKIALVNSIYADTDLHFFVGPAFVGTKERAECTSGNCTDRGSSYNLKSRMAFAPTFGLGLSFFTHEWGGLAADWRALPFSWNTGGFDTAGGGPDKNFPDLAISSADREFKFNQMITLSYSIFFPFEYRVSE